MRRKAVLLSVVAVVLLGVLAAGRTLPTTAQDAAGEGFVGSWRLTVTIPGLPPETFLATFGADGTFTGSPPPAAPAPPGAPVRVVLTSSAHGAWESTGDDGAAITFMVSQASEAGDFLGTVTVRSVSRLDAGGDRATGEFTFDVADPAGTVVQSGSGTLTATRIVVEPLGTPGAGSPAAGTPAP